MLMLQRVGDEQVEHHGVRRARAEEMRGGLGPDLIPARPALAREVRVALPGQHAGGGQFVQQLRRGVIQRVGHVGEIIVQRPGLARAGPVHASGAVTSRVQLIVNRRHGDQLRLRPFRLHAHAQAVTGAQQHAVEQHGMFLRINARDQCGVVRPGDGRIRHAHSLGHDALRGQLPQRGQRSLRVLQVKGRAAINRDEDDVMIRVRVRRPRAQPEQADRKSYPTKLEIHE